MIAMVIEKQEKWDEHSPFISMTQRATPHKATVFSSNFLMYGLEPHLPVDVILPLPLGQKMTSEQYAHKLQKQLQFAYEMARVSVKRSAERQIKLYNQSRYSETMNVGDMVWVANKLRKKGVSHKFQSEWRGA